MAIQYYMRAYNTTLSQYVDWIVNDQPDSTGAYSPYLPSQLINITVNKVVGSKIDNFLQPDEGFTISDGYFFHLNSFDWLHASVPTATVIPPPTSYVGVAVTRGGTTNGTGQLLPGVSTNFFATMLWDESEQRWKFVKNINGDHTTLGDYLPLGTGSLVVDGYIAVGTGPTVINMPTTGSLRLQNNQWITARKLGNTDGYLVRMDTLDRVQLGNTTESPFIYIPGNLRVGLTLADGYIRDAGTVSIPTTGFIRNSNNTSIITLKNLAGTVDITALSSTTTNNVVIGDSINEAVRFNTATAVGVPAALGVHQFQVNGTTLVEIGNGNPTINPFIRFTAPSINPFITQTNTGAGSGQTLSIQAQTTTAGQGGILVLSAGDGSTTHGSVQVRAGAATPKLTIFPTVSASAADNNSVLLNENKLRFASTESNPSILQDLAASGTGQIFTLQAQNITTGTGGEVRVTSGSGTSSVLAGVLNLQTGGTNRLTIVGGATASTGTTTHHINIEEFDPTVPNPLIRQAITGSATGQILTLQAQNALTNGGAIVLTSGTGSIDANAGTFDIQTGTRSRMLITAAGATTATALFNINAFSIVGGSDATNIPNPIWKQLDRTSGSPNGQIFTIQAQTSTVAGSIGGDLVLGAGDGILRDGYVRIQTGFTDRVIITETQTIVLGDFLVLGTHTTVDSTVVELKDRVIHVNSTAASYPVVSPIPTSITGFSVDRGTIAGPAKRDYYGLFWYETAPDGYWRFGINTDGYSPGTEQNLSLTLPVMASTFLAQPSAAPLTVPAAATIPTVGGFRALNNTVALSSRHTDAVNDLILVSTDSSNKLIWGASANNTGHIFRTTVGTIYDFRAADVSTYQIIPISNGATTLKATAAVTSVTYTQDDLTTASGTGAATTIRAQNETGTTSIGGALNLNAGTGTSIGGAVNITTGSGITAGLINFLIGGVQAIAFNNVDDDASGFAEVIKIASTITTPRIFQASTVAASGQILALMAQNAATTGGPLQLHSGAGATNDGYINLTTGNTVKMTVYPTTAVVAANNNSILFFENKLRFDTAQTTPLIRQDDKTTASGTGETLTLQAQNETGTTSNGGDLNLTSGTGTSLDGYLNLQSGGSAIVRVHTNKVTFLKGFRRHITNITGTYQVLVTDNYLAITTLSAPFTITLPANPLAGDEYIVKDTTGNAAISNVTIAGNGNNIDGSATFLFSQPYAGATFTFAGGNWSVT